MGGGLMQLVAYGAQDIYLTGNPQITFFKVVYRRHTNFSMEAIEQTWNGPSIGSGRCIATISRNGDLIHGMYLEINNATAKDPTTNYGNPGANMIIDIELEIGGQRIDKHTGQWMEVWAELTEPNSGGVVMQGDRDQDGPGTLFQRMSGMGGMNVHSTDENTPRTYYIPLQFWFCRNTGLSLPLISLQYHEVKVILNHQLDLVFGTESGRSNVLLCDYIYLDTDERRRFAKVSHEYLIEQVQHQSFPSGTSFDLMLNHPVKEIIWTGEWDKGNNTSLPITTGGKWQLKLNGIDRFSFRNFRYFTALQVWRHHTGGGGLDSSDQDGEYGGRQNHSIAVYSFSLKPEEHQPSGTCNFSRIDNAQLLSTETTTASINVYAVNYNILRIMSGMGGLVYSN